MFKILSASSHAPLGVLKSSFPRLGRLLFGGALTSGLGLLKTCCFFLLGYGGGHFAMRFVTTTLRLNCFASLFERRTILLFVTRGSLQAGGVLLFIYYFIIAFIINVNSYFNFFYY